MGPVTRHMLDWDSLVRSPRVLANATKQTLARRMVKYQLATTPFFYSTLLC